MVYFILLWTDFLKDEARGNRAQAIKGGVEIGTRLDIDSRRKRTGHDKLAGGGVKSAGLAVRVRKVAVHGALPHADAVRRLNRETWHLV